MRWVVCFIALLLAACGQRPGSGVLRVGMELAYPPYEMTDERGQPAGLSVDLANALGEFMFSRVEIENIPFDGLIPSLKTGKIDLIISSMTATPERAQSIAFSEPYQHLGLAMLVPAKSDVQSVGDLAKPGRVIAAKKGSTGHLFAVEKFPRAQVHVLDKEAACVLEVTQSRADAFFYDQLSILRNWQRNPETTRALLEPVRTEPLAVGLRLDDEKRREQVNTFLANFRAQGGFERLTDKWLHAEKQVLAERGISLGF